LRFRFSGRFLKINKSGCDLIGFSEENILYHNFDEFVHPDDKEIFNDQVTDLEKRKVHSNLKIAMLRVMVILFGLVGIVTQP
jgi:PAS domain S-box-containing protein